MASSLQKAVPIIPKVKQKLKLIGQHHQLPEDDSKKL